MTIGLDIIVGAVIEGITGLLGEKAIEATPRVVKRIHEASKIYKEQPLPAMGQAIQHAVEAARQDVLDEYFAHNDPVAQDALKLFEKYNTFAEAVTRKLFNEGTLDFERLRQMYLEREPGATSERWQALAEPLLYFFNRIEKRMTLEPTIGPLLIELRELTVLTRLDQTNQIIADATQGLHAYNLRIVYSSESSATSLEKLVRDYNLGNGQILSLLRQLIMQQQQVTQLSSQAPSVGLPGLHETELGYWRSQRDEYNQLLLIQEDRSKGDHRNQKAKLSNVYVDLQTNQRPQLEYIFDRLHISANERTRLLEDPQFEQTAENDVNEEINQGSFVPMSSKVRLVYKLGQIDSEEFEKHPLRPWAKDMETLNAAGDLLTALEAVRYHAQLVLLGDPGSGKSTFINHLAYTLAGAWLGDDEGWRTTMSEHFPQPLFPLRLILRKWSAQLTPKSKACAELLYAALAEHCDQHDKKHLLARLEDSNTLLLLDGLDEVPVANEQNEFDRRRIIVDSVEALRVAHPNCRLLITCRVKPYEQGNYQLDNIPVFHLEKLDDRRIERFVHRWYDELQRIELLKEADSQYRRKRLLDALPRRKVLRDMAGTPLLLTMLARVNARHELPESRVELYHQCVEQLLWDWESNKQERSEDGQVIVGQSLVDLLRPFEPSLKRSHIDRILWELTFHAHEQSGTRTAEIPASKIEEKLISIHPLKHGGKAWASQVVELMQDRSGLLVESGPGVFTFPHRSFQEYLAARWLLAQTNKASQIATLGGNDIWREVILLACAFHTKEGYHDDVLLMINALITDNQVKSDKDCSKVVIAGQALLEFGLQQAAQNIFGKEPVAKIPPLLVRVMQRSKSPAAQRLEAGLLAADLGDLPDDLDAIVPIAAQAKLGYDFEIARYPVTNAQYQAFIDADGYDQSKPWWNKAAIDDIMQYYSKWPTIPRYWNNAEWNHATQPVTGVSWYEAKAYCQWLTKEWQKLHRITKAQKVDLSTEAEWLWVAGGPTEEKYPWAKRFDASKCNSAESNLQQPSPVHMYPGGKTASGVWDLAGNVWEWMNEDEEEDRAWLRGGAYYSDKENVGSAARSWNPRVHDWYFYGFRVVVVPSTR
ncbi:MAG: SUMF1/EgtB/PvdO family nonheme iron enzyme [Caldilineaceae bacterium]